MLNNKDLDDNDKGESAKRFERSDEGTQEVKGTEISEIKFN